uniref:Uncharacterized protein LOC116939095 isoform X1 n=1 Tax=Petromyzon marinus TaxID=7757 RepID=A0AAJ7SR10_PETMA|nr:uncharacterized protein LOC116939095 isoform X1 [Petromyzon marinus]
MTVLLHLCVSFALTLRTYEGNRQPRVCSAEVQAPRGGDEAGNETDVLIHILDPTLPKSNKSLLSLQCTWASQSPVTVLIWVNPQHQVEEAVSTTSPSQPRAPSSQPTSSRFGTGSYGPQETVKEIPQATLALLTASLQSSSEDLGSHAHAVGCEVSLDSSEPGIAVVNTTVSLQEFTTCFFMGRLTPRANVDPTGEPNEGQKDEELAFRQEQAAIVKVILFVVCTIAAIALMVFGVFEVKMEQISAVVCKLIRARDGRSKAVPACGVREARNGNTQEHRHSFQKIPAHKSDLILVETTF